MTARPMQSIRVDDIEIGERHRSLSEPDVQRLAASIREIGLRQPITVRVVDEMDLRGELTAGVPFLVAGRHRLAAAKALGWSHIECLEVEDDPIAAELWELAENLHRCDLTKDQRGAHIRRYAELIEQRAVIVPQIAEQSRPVGRPKSTITQVSEATGLSDDTVRRALNPKQPTQPKPAKRAPDVSVRGLSAQARLRLKSAWNRAAKEDRAWFLKWIDAPAVDREPSK